MRRNVSIRAYGLFAFIFALALIPVIVMNQTEFFGSMPKTSNYVQTKTIADALGAAVDVEPCVTVRDDPGYINADIYGINCYNWQGFSLPVPAYAFDTHSTEVWEVQMGITPKGYLGYNLMHMRVNAATNTPILENPFYIGVSFANIISEEQYNNLMKLYGK